MPTINTDNRIAYPLTAPVLGAMVWTKPNWQSEWVQRDDLFPTDCQWTAGTTLPSATLNYRYGEVLLPGYPNTVNLSRITARGYFVLIAWGTHDGIPLYWLGFAESAITSGHVPARNGQPDTGTQTIPCFGLARALQECWIVTTVHENPDEEADEPKRSFGGSVFNKNNRGNRSSTKQSFEDGLEGYVFANPDEDGDWWNSRDIIEHLFAFHLPTPASVKTDGGIPWTLAGVNALPNWDRPVIDTDGQNVSQILAKLVSSERLLNWTVGANAQFVDFYSPPTIDELRIQLFTHVPSPLSLPAFGNVPANTNQLNIICSQDPKTKVTVTEDESEVVDQLILRGPREMAVATFTLDEFEEDWTPADETEYGIGGANSAGWSTLRLSEKRERNDAVRADSKLAKVYRSWRLKKDWDGQVEGFDDERLPVFYVPDEGDTYVPFLGGIEFLESLPLYAGVDYTEAVDDIDEDDARVRMQPIFMIENPQSEKLEDFSRSHRLSVGFRDGSANAIPVTLTGNLDNEFGPRITINVDGGPQHAIIKDFVQNDADVPQKRWGEFDHETMQMTLAVKNDRRPWIAIPASVSADVVRRKLITIEHPSLELVYIAESTLVGFEDDGEPKYQDAGGVLRDPTNQFKALGTMMGSFYLQPRRRCVIETGWRWSSVQIGSILTSVSTWSGPINAPVIEIRVQNPLQSGAERVAPTMTIVAATQRFDPMALLVPIDEEEVEQEPR